MKSIHVNDQLHYRLKLISLNTGKKIVDLVEELIRDGLLKLQCQVESKRPEETILSLLNSLRLEAKNLPNPEFDFIQEEKEEFSQMARTATSTLPTMLEEKE